MNKQILKQYVDACALVKDAEKELAKIKAQELDVQQDTVQSSMKDFPYTRTTMKIEGASEKDMLVKSIRVRAQEKHLEKLKENAEVIKWRVEDYLLKAPIRIQRIIRYKYFDNMSWEQVAEQFGRNANGESLRAELARYEKNNKGE